MCERGRTWRSARADSISPAAGLSALLRRGGGATSPQGAGILKNLTRLLADEEAVTAMEYGLLAAAIAGVLILVMYFFANQLGNAINNVAAHIN